ncbi:MAG: tryptophan-rich sensory protein [Anaerolineae bacterium]|nr:tryptophan-rich sensory protein [Anaerolineae bacterium]
MKHPTRQIIIAVAVLATITVNILANALPINGQNTGEISDRFAILFVPAGYVFSIWGLIYLGLIAYVIYQLLPAQQGDQRLAGIFPWVLAASLSNIAWIFLWHYNQFPLTLLAMVALLISLIGIFIKLRIGTRQFSTADTWLVNIPWSIYLGWITVAMIANVTQVLYFINWDGFGLPAEVWAVVMLAAVVIVSAWMAVTRGQPAYLFVIVWASIGIALKQAAYPLVAGAAWATAGIVFLLAVWRIIRPPYLRRSAK